MSLPTHFINNPFVFIELNCPPCHTWICHIQRHLILGSLLCSTDLSIPLSKLNWLMILQDIYTIQKNKTHIQTKKSLVQRLWRIALELCIKVWEHWMYHIFHLFRICFMYFNNHLLFSSCVCCNFLHKFTPSGGWSRDGGGIGWGDHFLPDKFIKRTIERWGNSPKQLLNTGGGHQAPRKAAHSLWKECCLNGEVLRLL